LTKYENGKTLEVQVCEVCAKKLGYMNQQDDTYSLHDLLSGFFNMTSPQVDMQNNHLFEQMEETECPKCHLSFREFQKIGKFGCSDGSIVVTLNIMEKFLNVKGMTCTKRSNLLSIVKN